jgi:hypothetical protein
MGFACDDATFANPAVFGAAVINVNNIYLQLACEKNELINSAIIEKVMSGQFKMLVPYTTCYKNSSSLTNAAIQIQVNPMMGKKLKHITHTIFNGTETGTTQYDCSNWDGEKIISYQTAFNSSPLQDAYLYCLQPGNTNLPSGVLGGDDWQNNKKFCDETPLLNMGVYQLNWFHRDSWAGDDSTDDLEDNLDTGMPIETVNLWSINANTVSANYQHYTYVTFLREMRVLGAQGFEWV